MLTNAECVFCRENLTLSLSRPAHSGASMIAPSYWWREFDSALQSRMKRYIKPSNRIFLNPRDARSRVVINLCISNIDTAVACHLDCLAININQLKFIIESISHLPSRYQELYPVPYLNIIPVMTDTTREQYQALHLTAYPNGHWVDQVKLLSIERKYLWSYHSVSKIQQRIKSRWVNLLHKLLYRNSLESIHFENLFDLTPMPTDIVISSHAIWFGFEPIVSKSMFTGLADSISGLVSSKLWRPTILIPPAYSEREPPPPYSATTTA